MLLAEGVECVPTAEDGIKFIGSNEIQLEIFQNHLK